MPLYLQNDLSSNMTSAFYSSQRRGGGGDRGRGGRDGPGGRGGPGGRFGSGGGSGAAWDTLIAKMQRQSFADLNPEKQAGLYRQVLDAKGGPHFFK